MPQIKSPVTNTVVAVCATIFLLIPEKTMFDMPVSIASKPWVYMQLTPVEFYSGSFWQPLSYAFIHNWFIHLFFNMLALWSLGRLIETVIGSVAFLQLYLISALGGGLAVALFQSGAAFPTMGASGAVLGCLSALGLIFPNARLLVFVFPMRAETAIYAIFGVSVVMQVTGVFPLFSHIGHIGGLVAGYVFTKLWIRRNSARLEEFKTPDFWQNVRDRFGQGEDAWRDQDRPDGPDGPFDNPPADRFGRRGRQVRPTRFKSIYYNPETGRFEVRD